MSSDRRVRGVARRDAGTAAPRARVARLTAWAMPLTAALLAAFAYRDTLLYFFSQDAFTVLARVRGLEKMPGLGWRWISGDLYFRLGDHLFGLDPRPYRIVALTLHAVNAGLVVTVARRLGLAAAPALFAAAFFGTHYAYFDALYSVAGAGELLAATFALLALVVALPGARGAEARWRWPVETLCYAAALSSKENVLLLPGLIWLADRVRASSARFGVVPMTILGALYVVRFVVANPFGAWGAATEANPYRPHLGFAMLDTWSTYLAWSLGFFDTRFGHIMNELGHEHRGWWFMAAITMLLIMLWRRRRAKGEAGAPPFQAAVFGAAGYAAFILPVLPLAGHPTHQYLYLPIALLALVLGAALEAWVPQRLAALTVLLALFVAGFGAVMVQSIELAQLPGSTLPQQGTVRRAVVAKRVFEELPAAPAPPPAELEMLGPDALNGVAAPDTSALARYLYFNFSAALDEGRAVRLLYPSVEKVTLYPSLGPFVRSPDVIVFGYDGSLKRGPTAWLYLRRAEVEWSAGRGAQALEALSRAEDMTSRWQREVTQAAWREEGAAGIRAQAEAMLATENREPASPASVTQSAYRDALRRILARVR